MELNVGDIVQLSDKFMQCMQLGAASKLMFPAFAASNGLAEVITVDGQMVRITPATPRKTVGVKADQVILMLDATALAFMGCHKINGGQPAAAAALPEAGVSQELAVCSQDSGVESRPSYDSGLPHPFALGRVPAVVSQAYWIYGGTQASKQQYASQASETYAAGLQYRRDGDDEVRPVSIALGECEQQLLVTSTNIIGEYMAMQFETFRASYVTARGAGDFFGAVAADIWLAETSAEVGEVDEPIGLVPTLEPQTQQTFDADW